jgi:hypothetical protein
LARSAIIFDIRLSGEFEWIAMARIIFIIIKIKKGKAIPGAFSAARSHHRKMTAGG